MKTATTINTILFGTLLAALLSLAAYSNTLAHVIVKPSDVRTAIYETFTVNVPNEKDIPTTSIKIVIPDAVSSVTPTQKFGWQITKETSGSGESTKTTAITWHGATIAKDTRDEFSFSAKTPNDPTKLSWKAYQTYADGTVVAWDQSSTDSHGHDADKPNSGPFSVTNVVAQTPNDTRSLPMERMVVDAKTASDRSFYISIAALCVGLFGIFLATRRK